jgi:histidine decarboxylase
MKICSVYAANTGATVELSKELNTFIDEIISEGYVSIGFPSNQDTDLSDFYNWYIKSKLFDKISLNNVANPRLGVQTSRLNAYKYENETTDFFAALYGFEQNKYWGIITFSGTDSNNHGIYFGRTHLVNKTNINPILYVSVDAHYSIKRIADVQQIEVREIPSDSMGHMDISEFERILDPSRPALIVITVGTTFKGSIDDQTAIDNVLRRKLPIAVYKHLDAALFGGYLPFTMHSNIINKKIMDFNSIAVSGHKFFGIDEPMGIFITTDEVFENQHKLNVKYLNSDVPTITCSRSGLAALKFWWKIKKNTFNAFKIQAENILNNARYLKEELDKIGYPSWINQHSNVVFFKRPDDSIINKWSLALSEDSRLGGKLAHVVVMQHVTRDVIDRFIVTVRRFVA